jgi:hypothetical protein
MGRYHLTRDLEPQYVTELGVDADISVSIFEESKRHFRVIVDASQYYETGFASHSVKTLEEAYEFLDDPGFRDEVKAAISDLVEKVESKRKRGEL